MKAQDLILDDFIQNLKRKTTYNDAGCWLYLQTNTYILVNLLNRDIGLHRLSASFYLDLDLNNTKLQANHKCPNRNCWNPDHIYVGTHQDNMNDLRSYRCSKCGQVKDAKYGYQGRMYCRPCNNVASRRAYHKRKGHIK